MKKTLIVALNMDYKDYQLTVVYVPGESETTRIIESVTIRPKLFTFTLVDLEYINESVRAAVSDAEEQGLYEGIKAAGSIAVVNNGLGLLVKKLFTTKSDEDKIDILDRIRTASESKMSDREKKAAKGMIQSLYDFVRASK